jgi:all-trans-retinol 13,14-reductase
MHCLLHGSSPREVTFLYHSSVIGSYYESIHSVAGGGRNLVAAFEKELANKGVTLFCGQGAQSIFLDSSGHFAGVLLENGDRIEAKECFATIHPTLLLDLLPEGSFRPARRRRIANLDETPSAFIVYAESPGGFDILDRSNLIICEDGESDVFGDDGQSDGLPLFITRGETINSGHSRGVIIISPLSYDDVKRWEHSRTSRRPGDYYDYKEEKASGILEFLSKSCPDLPSDLRVVATSTPLTIRDYVNTPRGSLYGVKHKAGQYNPLPMTKVGGLYLGGQAVTGPGVLGAVMSSFLSCGAVFGHEHLQKELCRC